MNKNHFKSIMILNGDTQKTIADALNVSEQTVGDKVNGISEFKQSEIKMLIDRWKLSPEQVDEIFFSGEHKGVIL